MRNSWSQEWVCKCRPKPLLPRESRALQNVWQCTLTHLRGNNHGFVLVLLSRRIVKVQSSSFNVFLVISEHLPTIFPDGLPSLIRFLLDLVFLVTSLSPTPYTFTLCFLSMSPKWTSPLARSLRQFEAWCAFPSSWMLTPTPFPSDVTEGWITMPPIESKLNGSWLLFGLLANGTLDLPWNSRVGPSQPLVMSLWFTYMLSFGAHIQCLLLDNCYQEKLESGQHIIMTKKWSVLELNTHLLLRLIPVINLN